MTHSNQNPFADIQMKTRIHRRQHGCGAYTFEDGMALIQLAKEYQPRQVLELGSGLGYTACCLAYGSPNAQLDTIEGDELHVEIARQHIAQQNLDKQITVHHGNFNIVLDQFDTIYDMVFFDGFAPEPETLLTLYHLLIPKGILICANLPLSSGRPDAAQVERELNNTAHWERLDDIEGGQTAVLIKK